MLGMTLSAADIQLPGTLVRAIAVACAEFSRTGFAITRFTVIAATHTDEFEIVFVPEQAPGRTVRGGRTEAGRELHYWISAHDNALVRTDYAR